MRVAHDHFLSVNTQEKGAAWLQYHKYVSFTVALVTTRIKKTQFGINDFCSYLVMPVVNSNLGKMSLPSLSFVGEISNLARSVAIAIHTLAKPRYCPGHTLLLSQHTIPTTVENTYTFAQIQNVRWVWVHPHRLPKLVNTGLGWTRKGLCIRLYHGASPRHWLLPLILKRLV